MRDLKFSTVTIFVLAPLTVGILFTEPAYADFSASPVLTNPGSVIPNTGCQEGKITQDYIDQAYRAYRMPYFQGTIDALSIAVNCAEIGRGLNPNEIRNYIDQLSALGPNNPNTWPDFPFASGIYTPPTAVADNGSSTDSNNVLPAIIGAIGGVLESAIHNSGNQNSDNQPAQPAPQSPPSVASETANNQSPQANSILAQWGLQQVPCNSPGLVFISGLGNDVVCINPTSEIPVGEYRYNADTHQLVNVSSAPTVNTVD